MIDLKNHIGQWDYSTLPPGIDYGKNCYFEEKAIFKRYRSTHTPGLVIGDRVRIYNWAALSVEPSGYLEIGDDSILTGPVFWCAHHIVLGKRVKVSYNVMIADSDFHPKDPDLRRIDAEAIAPFAECTERPPLDCRPVFIEDDVEIGIGVIILKGVRIGAGAKLLPGTVVCRDVPPRATVGGNPARIASMES